MAITLNSGNVLTSTANVLNASGASGASTSSGASGASASSASGTCTSSGTTGASCSSTITATSNASTFTQTYTAYVPNTGSVSVTGTVIVSSVNTPTNSVTASPNITATAAVMTTTTNVPKCSSVTQTFTVKCESGLYYAYDEGGKQIAGPYSDWRDVPSSEELNRMVNDGKTAVGNPSYMTGMSTSSGTASASGASGIDSSKFTNKYKGLSTKEALTYFLTGEYIDHVASSMPDTSVGTVGKYLGKFVSKIFSLPQVAVAAEALIKAETKEDYDKAYREVISAVAGFFGPYGLFFDFMCSFGEYSYEKQMNEMQNDTKDMTPEEQQDYYSDRFGYTD